MNWWQRLRNRDRLETELDAELGYHVERKVEDNLRAGMSEQEARRQARLEVGGIDQVKEDCRDVRGTRWVDDIAQDLRFAARMLAKDRSFTLVAVVALALGIGASNTVFTIVNAMVLRGVPVREPDRIVAFNDANNFVLGVSYRDVEDWRAPIEDFRRTRRTYLQLPMLPLSTIIFDSLSK